MAPDSTVDTGGDIPGGCLDSGDFGTACYLRHATAEGKDILWADVLFQAFCQG